MTEDVGKRSLYHSILCQVEMFNIPSAEQRLSTIQQRLGMSKQNLNYYLQDLKKKGLVKQTQSYPFAIYQLTEPGRLVKENLGQSEPGVKRVWKYHNLILGYRVVSWGSWKFGKTVPMNNWSYQIIERPSGHIINVQTTGLIKIYIPRKFGEDPEIMRGNGYAECQEIARWFIDKYDMQLQQVETIRKGQKELIGSELLAKILGRVKSTEWWVDASGGTENLEEYDGSKAIENMLNNMQETPERLEKIDKTISSLNHALTNLAAQTQGLAEQTAGYREEIRVHRSVMKNIDSSMEQNNKIMQGLAAGITELRSAVQGVKGQTINSPENKEFETSEPGQQTLESLAKESRTSVKMLQDVHDFDFIDAYGVKHIIDIYSGGIISLAPGKALELIRSGKAQRILED